MKQQALEFPFYEVTFAKGKQTTTGIIIYLPLATYL